MDVAVGTAVPDVADRDGAAAARLARDCLIMHQAYQLAQWVGGGRPVTPGRVLRRPDVPLAGAALGLTLPPRMRTAADVPALHRPWCVAVATAALQVSGGKVTAGPALARGPGLVDGLDDDEVLAGWLAGLRAVCAAESDRRYPDSVAILVHSLLEVLSSDPGSGSGGQPPTGADLWAAVHQQVHHNDIGEFYHWTFDKYLDLDTGDPLGGLVVLLGLFGAVAGDSSQPRITPLGRWAVGRLHTREPEPLQPSLSADELIARLALLGESVDVWRAAQPWLHIRDGVAAAREILTAAATAPPRSRQVAVTLVGDLGDAMVPVWRELADLPNIGAHARAVLAWQDQAEDGPAVVSRADRHWLAVDAAAAALAGAGPDEALSVLYEQMPGATVASRLKAVRASGHPEAVAVARAVEEFVSSGAPRTVDRVHQLKVTLLRWRPPIWRRVLVPSVANLGELHQVIQVLFGWDGDHLHVFKVGDREYGDTCYLDDAREEFDLRIAAALPDLATKITYTYDLRAGWHHEIMLERVVDREPGRRYPACVAFRHDSPVEYWSPDDPREPKPYDMAAVNRRLAHRRG